MTNKLIKEKALFIAEKPSVAREFSKALNESFKSFNGYMESSSYVITWCVGHLVAMSYPEKYNPELKKWRLDTLPFIPQKYKYEVINGVKKQFTIVKNQLSRSDISTIYVCTDSGREGEYIYRLVKEQSGVIDKDEKRVWIDSQTEDEILRGIREARPLSEYDNLASSAYLRAIEDYLMGINFSRAMSLIYGDSIANALGLKYVSIAVGRVMTCVLGMVVRREREIRQFKPTPYFKIIAKCDDFEAQWRINELSMLFDSPYLYKENGILKRELAEEIKLSLEGANGVIDQCEKKKETVRAPLLYNLAELQNVCSKAFKISPDKTLQIAQELYEKKLITYPRTDARVLSKAVCKELYKNIKGIMGFFYVSEYAKEILNNELYKNISSSRYCDDKKITDHYAIIPTGFGLQSLDSLSEVSKNVYELICRRFLSIFYPPAIYQKINLLISVKPSIYADDKQNQTEKFSASFKTLTDTGYLDVSICSFQNDEKSKLSANKIPERIKNLKKGEDILINDFFIKENETSPPKRYNTGSMILAMENAGQLIEDEELRSQIKGSGIGTSATRAGILEKLSKNRYIKINQKTQIITPELLGEMIFDAVLMSVNHLLSPELTASWEKGLTLVADGIISYDEYMEKLDGFVRRRTKGIIDSSSIIKFRNKINQLKKVYNSCK